MIQAEYVRFLQTLNTEGVPAEVRKIGNLVFQHLDTLIPLSTAKGQRIKEIIRLAQSNWGSISADIKPLPDEVSEEVCPVAQLKSLSVGPFRGFAKQEYFDLDSKLVLIYGPNGTGKSSFCEALEYGLLNNVAEAENKRFQKTKDYLTNAHTKSFSPPVLIGVDHEGQEVTISANEALFRFCFIEKNRIDNFSRIAAQAPSKQSELISTLFGLDAFSDFVRNFTDSMDGKYIDLEGICAQELKTKQETLAGYQHQLTIAIPEELHSIESDEKTVANRYSKDCDFSQMVAELNGNQNEPGRIKQIEDELQVPIGSKSNLTMASLQDYKKSIETNIREFNTKEEKLSADSQKISFKQLYEAVSQLKQHSPQQCPACQTPLSEVAVNPFYQADEELIKLKHLSLLQEEIIKLKAAIAATATDLSETIKTCCSRFLKGNQLRAIDTAVPRAAAIDWWNSLHVELSEGLTAWQHLEQQVGQLEENDKKIDHDTETRVEKQAELRQLRIFAAQIAKLQTRRETVNTTKSKAQKKIDNFETNHAQLIMDVEAEKAVVDQNRVITNAYSSFVEKLNIYKNSLPAELIADLEGIVVELYNAFNRNDAEYEKLSSIRLPLQQNQRLEIAFKNEPGLYFDALHVLSEGHIRCVGLAILAAKNIKEGCPFLVFDDPVNAIDDEHRQSIRESLFVDNTFNGKQLIIAVHGEEFFNRTHQVIGKEAAKKAHSYLFSPRIDQHIQVNSLTRPKNYVLAAQELFKTGEYRDTLMSSRRALENLSEKAWYYYGKHSDKSDSLISVSMRAPNLPWDLRSLIENLKSKFDKSKAEIPNKDQIVNSLESLLGTKATQPPWTYLNKGTHDETDLPEFDQHTVSLIVTALEELEQALE